MKPRPTKAQNKFIKELIPIMPKNFDIGRKSHNPDTGEIINTVVTETSNDTVATPVLKSYKGKRIKWDTVGVTVEGRITRKSYIPMRSGDAAIQYTLEGGPDGAVSFLAGVQVAQALDQVPFGTYIRVTFNGREKGGAYGSYNDFDIMGEDVPMMSSRMISSPENLKALPAPRVDDNVPLFER